MAALHGSAAAAAHYLTEFHAAADAGDVDDLRLRLTDPGVEVDVTDDRGRTALYISCREGHADAAALLIDHGADVNIQSEQDGATPLWIACQDGRLDAATLLCNKGADVDRATDEGCTPLFMACQEGKFHVAKLCLDRGADVHRARNDGITVLHAACIDGHVGVATLLLDHGIAVDLASNTGSTPLITASEYGRVDCARLLLEWGADILARNEYERRPDKVAKIHGYTTMGKWLKRIRLVGWTHYVSAPRYKLVALRALVARGQARWEGTFHGKELVLDFLFPSDQPPPSRDDAIEPLVAPLQDAMDLSRGTREMVIRKMLHAAYDAGAASRPQANKRARRHQPRLPDELFSIIARFWWGGGWSAKEEIAAAVEAEESDSE